MAEDKKVENKKEINEEELKKVDGGCQPAIKICRFCGGLLHPFSLICSKCGKKN